jgi:hypothetical protein
VTATRAQAFNEWTHDLKGRGPVLYEAFKAGWTARNVEVKRLRTELRQCQEALTACLETTEA